MKFRISLAFLCILGFMACESADGGLSGGENPLDQCVIPAGASPGKEVAVQWNGFSQTAVISLKDSDGNVFPAEVKVVTSSGLIFNVPAGLAPGVYSVMLQGHGTPLGQMEVLPVDMPVTGLSFPSAVAPGEELIIRGVGFDEDYTIVFRSRSYDIELVPELVPEGIRLDIPSEMSRDTYRMILKDSDEEWLLDDSFMVTVRKRLNGVRKMEFYSEALFWCEEYILEYSGDDVGVVAIKSSLVDADGNIEEVSYEDRYIRETEVSFKVEGGTMQSNNYGFQYICSSDGRVLSADVHRYSISKPEGSHREFTWIYGPDGQPSDITFTNDGKIGYFQWYVYDSGNLAQTKACVFVYDGTALNNNPFAIDAAYAYDMMTNLMEPFLYVPYLTGIQEFASGCLPSGVQMAGQAYRFEYEFDADGYVTQMVWDAGNAKICFVYE